MRLDLKSILCVILTSQLSVREMIINFFNNYFYKKKERAKDKCSCYKLFLMKVATHIDLIVSTLNLT